MKNVLTKLVGLKEENFLSLIDSNQITYSEARLIPLLKTGDEMALTSIFLSSLKLIKEFRYSIFKEVKIPRSGKYYYMTEVRFPELSKCRVDGLIVVVKAGKITDAVIFEMKKEANPIDENQMKEYIDLAIKLKIPKLVTVSNQYVANPTQSPLDIRVSKKVTLFHFSWSYLLTIGRILLFKNDNNIEDEDQVEIMREVLYYFESAKSGIRGYNQMSPEWGQLTEIILAHQTIKESDPILSKALNSWYQEEKDMALKLSRELGVLVKTQNKGKEKINADLKYIIKNKSIKTKVSVKDAVSDIVIEADFEKKSVKFLINISCPNTGTNNSKVSWLIKQLTSGKKKSSESFQSLYESTYIAANIKYAHDHIIESLANVDKLKKLDKKEEIQQFQLYVVGNLGKQFTSKKGFIVKIEKLLIEFYDAYVQHLNNWKKPAPKIDHKENIE